jgi:hypothetical protein
MKPLQRRYERMLNLFDTPPSIHFRPEDRAMIERPFGILLASTTAKASITKGSEVNFKSAKLGDEFDVAFVRPEHLDQMNQWIQDHDLKNKVRVLDVTLLTKLEGIPLYHAPDQVKGAHPLLAERAGWLNATLNSSVFPLYKRPYPDGRKRQWHGVPHAARAVLFSQVLLEMAHNQGIEIKHDIVPLLLTMGLHDVARENDGVDFWDEASAQKAKEILMRDLNLSDEESSFFASCIADKDKTHPTSIEQMLIHDGDCIEIMRCLNDPHSFKMDELRMKDILGEEMITDLISDARKLIELTDKGVVKNFLESSKNPYQVLLQIVFHAHTEYGAFKCIVENIWGDQDDLNITTQYQLTTEVEDKIKESFSPQWRAK